LLPAFGDTALHAAAAERLAEALRARTTVEDARRLAAVLLEGQGPCGSTRWATDGEGRWINDGRYSFRNPTNRFALPADRLARVTAALSP
jgi:hypothetical protein